MATDLDGRVALVVGGTRNMGLAIAETVAVRGAMTIVSFAGDEDRSRRAVARLTALGVAAEAVRSDATVAADVSTLFEKVLARHGKLDIVVHVPGAVLKKPLAETTDAEYDRVMDLNTRSVFLTLRAAARHLSDGGRYVALSTSLTAMTTGLYGVYQAGKAAVEQLVKTAAQELGGRGITVNTINPGPIDDSFFHAAETPESVAWSTHANPRDRLGRPGDIAPVVGFLVGDEASWVTGQSLRVNGGMV